MEKLWGRGTRRPSFTSLQLYYARHMKPLILPFTLVCWLVLSSCASPTAAPPTLPASTAATANATGVGPAATPTGASPAASAVPTAATPAASAAAVSSRAPTQTSAPPTLVGTSTANPTIAGGLVGLWQGNNNSFYLLQNDGTWNWDEKLQNVLTAPENMGRWWVEGDIFRIEDTAGRAPCPPDQIGSYQAQLSGDKLILTAVADLCAPRIDQTAGQYARQPAGP